MGRTGRPKKNSLRRAVIVIPGGGLWLPVRLVQQASQFRRGAALGANWGALRCQRGASGKTGFPAKRGQASGTKAMRSRVAKTKCFLGGRRCFVTQWDSVGASRWGPGGKVNAQVIR